MPRSNLTDQFGIFVIVLEKLYLHAYSSKSLKEYQNTFDLIQCSLKVKFWYVAMLGKTNITSTYAKFDQFSLLVVMHRYAALTCCDWLSNFFILYRQFLRLMEIETLWSSSNWRSMQFKNLFEREKHVKKLFNMLYNYLQPAVTVKSGSTKYSSQIETT